MREIRIKIPDFKFPKLKMKGIEDIPEVNIDYDKIKKEGEQKKDKKQYKPTEYKTIKEIFEEYEIQFDNITCAKQKEKSELMIL